MSNFLNWLLGGGAGDSTSAQTATGIPQSAPATGFFNTPAEAPPLPLPQTEAAPQPSQPVPFAGPRAMPPLPAQPTPDTNNLPIGPGGLPDISSMLQNLKNAQPTPAQNAPADTPAPAVPPMPASTPIGAGAGLAPAGDQTALNAPAATGAPTPLVPAADTPAAPSQTPAGRSLLERIMGSDDASTKDKFGLTEADRHANGFNALAKLGFGIMAASMPQNPNERAAAIAQLGQIPAGMLKDRAAQIGMQAQAQQVQLRDQQLKAKQSALDYLKSPEMAATIAKMPASMQGAMKAMAAAGDLAGIVNMQKSLAPKLSGNTIYNPADGTWTNTVTNISGGPGGVSAGGGQGGGAAPTGPAPTDRDGKIAAAVAAQNIPEVYRQTVIDMINGDAKLPTNLGDRNGVNLMLTNAARKAAVAAGLPPVDQATYDLRQKAKKDYAPNGVTGSQMVSMNTFLQHTNDLQKAAGNLDNTSSPIWNRIKNTYNSEIAGGSAQDRFNQVRGLATKELDTLVSKNHATIAETQNIRENLNSAKTPEQMQAVIDEMASMAKARIQSQTQGAQNALGKKGFATIEEQLQNPQGAKALEEIEANPIKGSDRHKQYMAIRQQFGLAPTADVAHFEYSRDASGRVWKKPKK